MLWVALHIMATVFVVACASIESATTLPGFFQFLTSSVCLSVWWWCGGGGGNERIDLMRR